MNRRNLELVLYSAAIFIVFTATTSAIVLLVLYLTDSKWWALAVLVLFIISVRISVSNRHTAP